MLNLDDTKVISNIYKRFPYEEIDIVNFNVINNYLLKSTRFLSLYNKVFIRGEYSKSLFSRTLGVIGTRKISDYSKYIIKNIFSNLRRYLDDITIVSGFMTGVDYYAHKGAIENGFRTIAVMPCGINNMYPDNKISISLYKEILDSGGLVVSQFPEDQFPRKWTFVKRNELICTLSDSILVIEARESGGTVNCARLFMKMKGKEKLFCISDITDNDLFMGNNILIQEGAFSINSKRDIRIFINKLDYNSHILE